MKIRTVFDHHLGENCRRWNFIGRGQIFLFYFLGDDLTR
jgi:hypothetical protein